jgi:hypothetical protein
VALVGKGGGGPLKIVTYITDEILLAFSAIWA